MEKKSPDAFRTISEVAEWLDTPPHVLRFWESRFSQIKPVKRAGGRRYYRPADVALLGGIKQLLHDEGMTIRGVQKILREKGIRHVAELGTSPAEDGAGDVILADAVTAPTPRPVPVDNVVPMKRPRPTPEAEPEEDASAETKAVQPDTGAAPPGMPTTSVTAEAGAAEVEADAPGVADEEIAETIDEARDEDLAADLAQDLTGAPAGPSVTQHEFLFDSPSTMPSDAAGSVPDAPGLDGTLDDTPAPAVRDEATADESRAGSDQPEQPPASAPESPVPESPEPESPEPESPADTAEDMTADVPSDTTPEAAAEATSDPLAPADMPPEADEEKDGHPTLATRLRAIDPAQAGAVRDDLATLADRLRGLRSKMAGHARRSQK
ncbi:MerR family transcriptional regulator [Acidimangrovimonas sediminis]|uniref:MerR family transcriptional regulator n=1 Tax=Acidimangrovimonas sediminis TaxID=2056283 RepID=UPI001E36EEF8|nr:MerR family transcriptional regulator [Acidimangrovimonas sediminis]